VRVRTPVAARMQLRLLSRRELLVLSSLWGGAGGALLMVWSQRLRWSAHCPAAAAGRSTASPVCRQRKEPTPLPEPDPLAVRFQDPRVEAAQEVGLIGFYYPDREEPWDKLCGSGFMGNFWHLGVGALRLEAPCDPGRTVSFGNAEAAFQALKFWSRADEFGPLTGCGAFELKRSLAGSEDFTYGGFGSNWAGMRAVLDAKFRPRSPLAEALLRTGDSFLLEHNSVHGRDKVWSDNKDGSGTNWLGLQLMLLRDQLSGSARWTAYLSGLVNFKTGKPLGRDQAKRWQSAVRSAAQALVADRPRPSEPSSHPRPSDPSSSSFAAAQDVAAVPAPDKLPALPTALPTPSSQDVAEWGTSAGSATSPADPRVGDR